MPCNTGSRLERCAEYRIAGLARYIHRWHLRLNLGRGQNFAVDTIQTVGVGAPINITHILKGMTKVHYPPLAEHHVKIEFLTQPLPQLQGFFVEVGRLVPEIVGTDNSCVAARISTADPTFLQYRDAPNIMLGREVIGSRKSMTSTPHHDHIIGRRRVWATPGFRPVLVITDRITCQTEDGITVFSHTAPDPIHGLRPKTS